MARAALEQGIELGGEQRDVAVLFTDVIGSTELAGEATPEEVVELLNSFFGLVVDVVDEHGGWVNKFEGDAALAVFGAPIPLEQAPSAALAAARELADRLPREAEGLEAAIGVSAGEVVAGNVGDERRFEYTVIGDPVNEAARLTELAKERSRHVLASDSILERASEPRASAGDSTAPSPCAAEASRRASPSRFSATSWGGRHLRLAESVGVVGAEAAEGLVGGAVEVRGAGRHEAELLAELEAVPGLGRRVRRVEALDPVELDIADEALHQVADLVGILNVPVGMGDHGDPAGVVDQLDGLLGGRPAAGDKRLRAGHQVFLEERPRSGPAPAALAMCGRPIASAAPAWATAPSNVTSTPWERRRATISFALSIRSCWARSHAGRMRSGSTQ